MKRLLCSVMMLFSLSLFAEGFHGDTPILVEGEYKPIKKLKVADKVISYNETLATYMPPVLENIDVKKVKGVLAVQSTTMITLYVSGEAITLDSDNLVYSARDQKWIKAGEVTPGTILVDALMFPHPVMAVRSAPASASYVVEIEDNHTLFVGKVGILVHNGPVAAVICATVCKIIGVAGCGAGAILVAGLNPAIGIVYGAVCTVLDGGAMASCGVACLALPIF